MRGVIAPLLATLPLAAHAEGGARVMSCEVVTRCIDMACQGVEEMMTLRIEPVQIAADGTGPVMVRTATEDVAGYSMAALGPIVWSEHPDVANSLHQPSDTNAYVWHRFEVSNEVRRTTTLYLFCEVT